ncbi:MAG: hypothetical protein HY080_06260 [Gammaproteobacteria bacterium]|nr:hypothetical protein [Gammaproteobacteria bacterium]
MKKILLTLEAIKLTNDRLAITPDFHLLKSVKAQLNYILESFKQNTKPTDAEKDRITLGILAVRDFEVSDSEYADILEKVSYLYKHPEVDEI